MEEQQSSEWLFGIYRGAELLGRRIFLNQLNNKPETFSPGPRRPFLKSKLVKEINKWKQYFTKNVFNC